MQPTRSANEGGFSYLEVLVGMVVVAVLFPALMALFTGGTAAVKEGERELVALRLAEQVLEEARALAAEQQLEESALAARIPEPPDTHQLVFEIQPAGDNLVEVTVSVSWPASRGGEGSLTLQTLIFQPGD